jgi:uncharacterized membrane protein
MTKSLEDLKKRMEGKTVIRVDPPEATEAICRFHMSDGSVFRLHATDLGFWVEDTIAPEAAYTVLDMMFRDYEHHVYHMEGKTPTKVAINFSAEGSDIEVVIEAPDGRIFKASVSKYSSDRILLERHDAIDLLPFAAEMGDMWRMAFKS